MTTKMTAGQRKYNTEMRNDFMSAGGELFFFRDIGLTIALIENFAGSQWACMGIAWQSPSEPKFDRLIGASQAIRRCDVPVPCTSDNFDYFAQSFANLYNQG
jgi:hypothetical protein